MPNILVSNNVPFGGNADETITTVLNFISQTYVRLGSGNTVTLDMPRFGSLYPHLVGSSSDGFGMSSGNSWINSDSITGGTAVLVDGAREITNTSSNERTNVAYIYKEHTIDLSTLSDFRWSSITDFTSKNILIRLSYYGASEYSSPINHIFYYDGANTKNVKEITDSYIRYHTLFAASGYDHNQISNGNAPSGYGVNFNLDSSISISPSYIQHTAYASVSNSSRSYSRSAPPSDNNNSDRITGLSYEDHIMPDTTTLSNYYMRSIYGDMIVFHDYYNTGSTRNHKASIVSTVYAGVGKNSDSLFVNNTTTTIRVYCACYAIRNISSTGETLNRFDIDKFSGMAYLLTTNNVSDVYVGGGASRKLKVSFTILD